MPGFGRIYKPDARDKNFPMRLLLDPLREQYFPKGIPPGKRRYRYGKQWLQGNTGTCVEHGMRHKAGSAPIMQELPMPHFDLYREIVKRDPWPENDFEATAPVEKLQSGTDVRTGFDVLKDYGYIKSYLHANSTEDARAWMLANFGGLVAGTYWTTGMMNTDSEGFIKYTGNIEGGHCYYLGCWSDEQKHNGRIVRAVEGLQSWEDWGIGGKGRFWIEEDDLAKLLADEGELIAGTEHKVKPLKVV